MSRRNLLIPVFICLFVFWGQVVIFSSSSVEAKILAALEYFQKNPPHDYMNAVTAFELIIDSMRIITPKTKYSEEVKSKILKVCDLPNDKKGEFEKNWFKQKFSKLKESFKELYFIIDLDNKRSTQQKSKNKIAPIAKLVHEKLEEAHNQAKKCKYDDCLKSLLQIFFLF